MRLLLRLSLNEMNVMKLIKLYLMPIAARSAPNNGRVKEAKVSSCTRGTGKALNGKAKRDVNRRANSDERRDIREDIMQAKRGNKNRDNKDDIKEGRGENKSGNVRGNGELGSAARRPALSLFSFSSLFTFLFLLSLHSSSLFSYTYSRKLSTRTSSIKHHIISFIFTPHGLSYISPEI